MKNTWREKRLEIITLGVFLIVVLTSLLSLYNSYTNYSHLAIEGSKEALVHQVIMGISATILFLSLLIVYSKRDYFFQEQQDSSDALETLFEEVKTSSDKDKEKAFKEMLKEKNHTEIYGLITKMIHELNDSKKSVDEANKVKTLFLSNISHEIRTPITGIIGFSELLESTKLNREQREFLSIIEKSSKDLLGVVNNILDISKIEHGEFVINHQKFNLIDELDTFIDIYAIDAFDKELSFSLLVDPTLSTVLLDSDKEKIKQILTNLLSNAIKFTPRGGDVKLRVHCKNITENAIKVEFSVEDTGVGIDKSQRKDVFSLFSQADNSSTRPYSGVGLGLTIANKLVKMLGGLLELESELGKGSRFSFILNMEASKIVERREITPPKVAIYTPKEISGGLKNRQLWEYLEFFNPKSLEEYSSYRECHEAGVNAFDILYINYEEIDIEELKRIVAQYGSEKEIVLLTKLSNRENLLDISAIFSKIIYEPLTFPKVEHSLRESSQNLLANQSKNNSYEFDLKALIVEDNIVNQKVLLHTLKRLGIEADIANNGEEGVHMFKRGSYNIVFMDIQMPVMSGVVATKHILEYEEEKGLDHTPIVAVTTNSLEGDRELYLKSGMDEYIAKPISSEKFIGVIKQFYVSKNTQKEKDLHGGDILLYRKSRTDGIILKKLLQDSDYNVTLAKSREEFYALMKRDEYKVYLLDKRMSREDETFMEYIVSQRVPTLFLIDEQRVLGYEDFNAYTKVLSQSAEFSTIHEELEKMMEL